MTPEERDFRIHELHALIASLNGELRQEPGQRAQNYLDDALKEMAELEAAKAQEP